MNQLMGFREGKGAQWTAGWGAGTLMELTDLTVPTLFVVYYCYLLSTLTPQIAG